MKPTPCRTRRRRIPSTTQAGLAQALAEREARVLASPVAVMDEPFRCPPVLDRHVERVEHEVCLEVVSHRPPDDATSEEVQHEREV